MWPSSVEAASSLGWAAPITMVANEVRFIGFVIIGLALTLAGIYVALRRRMEELGDTLAAISVGGALIGGGIAATATLLGFAAGAPLLGVAVSPGMVESLATLVSFWAWHGPLLAGGVALWRRIRRG
jgi:hypothetical protein